MYRYFKLAPLMLLLLASLSLADEQADDDLAEQS
jgi:hypothetical protein